MSPTTPTYSQRPHRLLPGFVPFAGLLLAGLCLQAAWATSGDDFNDSDPDGTRWAADSTVGSGRLDEANQRLEYTCSSPSGRDDVAIRPWVLTRMPTNGDWEVQVDLVNTTAPSQAFQVNSFGIKALHPRTGQGEMAVEMYCSSLGGGQARTGFWAALETNGVSLAEPDSGAWDSLTYGAVRMAYTAATRVVSVGYDMDPSDGYQWVFLGSFGLAGADGADANTDWGLLDTDQFPVYLYGYSYEIAVASGQMSADNFSETGGVPPNSTPSPDPIGSFRFRPPPANPFLTAILNLTGSYRLSRTLGGGPLPMTRRTLAVDIAQDESGKLSTMARVDGVLADDGSPEVTTVTGAVTTSDGKPTATFKGKGQGTADGLDISGGGSLTLPVEVIDLGKTNPGVEGTTSYKWSVTGVPLTSKNEPFALPLPPESLANLQSDWSLDLDLRRTTINGKEVTVASALLTLPGGDITTFPERAVKYSATKGYSLSFKKGTNTSATPPKADKRSAVSIKGLTFAQQGAAWVPTGGTITYQFLGQKGTANLMDFVPP